MTKGEAETGKKALVDLYQALQKNNLVPPNAQFFFKNHITHYDNQVKKADAKAKNVLANNQTINLA